MVFYSIGSIAPVNARIFSIPVQCNYELHG
jgi:hypothetical protein